LDASGKVIAITDESISNIKAHTTYEINSGGLFPHRGETTSKIKSVKVIASAPYTKY
jgi:glycerol-3-phosphate responsive antiterminator